MFKWHLTFGGCEEKRHTGLEDKRKCLAMSILECSGCFSLLKEEKMMYLITVYLHRKTLL